MPRTRPLESSLLNPWFFFSKQLLHRPIRADAVAAARRVSPPRLSLSPEPSDPEPLEP